MELRNKALKFTFTLVLALILLSPWSEALNQNQTIAGIPSLLLYLVILNFSLLALTIAAYYLLFKPWAEKKDTH